MLYYLQMLRPDTVYGWTKGYRWTQYKYIVVSSIVEPRPDIVYGWAKGCTALLGIT